MTLSSVDDSLDGLQDSEYHDDFFQRSKVKANADDYLLRSKEDPEYLDSHPVLECFVSRDPRRKRVLARRMQSARFSRILTWLGASLHRRPFKLLTYLFIGYLLLLYVHSLFYFYPSSLLIPY